LAVASYQDVSWNEGDNADRFKLNRMAQNSRYLFERAPKLYYNAYNVKKDVGVKIACGVVAVPATKNTATTVTVNFGSFFTTGTRPIPVTSLTSPSNLRVIETTYGLGGLATVPDHRGFNCRVAATEIYGTVKYIPKTMYLNWLAMGY
jgi:hypothetical protein